GDDVGEVEQGDFGARRRGRARRDGRAGGRLLRPERPDVDQRRRRRDARRGNDPFALHVPVLLVRDGRQARSRRRAGSALSDMEPLRPVPALCERWVLPWAPGEVKAEWRVAGGEWREGMRNLWRRGKRVKSAPPLLFSSLAT